MKYSKGVTIVEVMVIITIVILIAMVLVPNYLRARAGGQYTQCQSNCKNMGTALEMFAEDNERKFPLELASITPGYLRVLPTCASSSTNKGYINSYHVSPDLKTYTFFCAGKNHEPVGVPENYPSYSSIDGLTAKP